jgi:hypothetical protein
MIFLKKTSGRFFCAGRLFSTGQFHFAIHVRKFRRRRKDSFLAKTKGGLEMRGLSGLRPPQFRQG